MLQFIHHSSVLNARLGTASQTLRWQDVNHVAHGTLRHPQGHTLSVVSRLHKMLTVFPDPVWAHAIKSRPASIIGMLYFCTGVSLEYPALAMFIFKV